MERNKNGKVKGQFSQTEAKQKHFTPQEGSPKKNHNGEKSVYVGTFFGVLFDICAWLTWLLEDKEGDGEADPVPGPHLGHEGILPGDGAPAGCINFPPLAIYRSLYNTHVTEYQRVL